MKRQDIKLFHRDPCYYNVCAVKNKILVGKEALKENVFGGWGKNRHLVFRYFFAPRVHQNSNIEGL